MGTVFILQQIPSMAQVPESKKSLRLPHSDTHHPLPVPLPSRTRGLSGTIFVTWMDFMYVRRCPVAKARRDSVYRIYNTFWFLYYFFIGRRADKKVCGG